MYEAFYGLKDKPFDLHPDPDYVYMSSGHENAFSHLEYAIVENKGFVVITGEIGSGKTTLINLLLKKVPQDVNIGLINNTVINPNQLIRLICQEFELKVDGLDKTEMLELFNQYLVEQYARRYRVVLIIDEAQNLPKSTIEEIRLLSNLEAEKHHLIQIIMVGQPELRTKLLARGLEQFVQRVTVHCHLNGLDKDEVARYVHHRLKVAGAKNLNLFDQTALEAIARYSRGVPRLINILCDTALVYGYADDIKAIDGKIIKDVVESRQIGGIVPGDDQGPAEIASTGRSLEMESEAWDQVKKRINSMERRMVLLENATLGLEKKVDVWLGAKVRQDDLVLELFRMLKENMNSRKKMVERYYHLKRKYEAAETRTEPELEITPKVSFFSRWRRRGPGS
ncbi:MAG: AAA family ATPase [Thermodesulfobacteriota bacterium]